MPILCLLSLFVLAVAAPAVELPPKPLLQDDDTLVFVGDSITGQGANIQGGGYYHVFRRALDAARPGNTISLAALGGSGQGVRSWLIGVEQKSRNESVILDVKGVDAQQVLTKDVDVIVIMLGMNDSLHPYYSDDAEGIAKWEKDYSELVTRLRERCEPRVIAVASVTPNTEDPESPKNRFLARLTERLQQIAKDQRCVYLPVAAAAWDMQAKGRRLKYDFHLTSDYVHPNHFGHAAIAYGMLSGLGEEKAAAHTKDQDFDGALRKLATQVPMLSYDLQNVTVDAKGIYTANLAWYWTGTEERAQAQVKMPEGWKAKPAKGGNGREGIITIEGPLERLETPVLLAAQAGGKTLHHDIRIPAPWLIAHGFKNMEVWTHGSWNYVPEKGKMPGEDDILLGRYIDKTPTGWKAPLQWSRFVPSINHTHGASPGNVPLYQVDFAAGFSGAYGLRWIHSEQPRKLRLAVGTHVFAGGFAVTVLLNGDTVYSGVITKEAGRRVEREITLNAGWNLLAFKSNNMNWQWQFSLDLESDESLEDLRVSVHPQR